jgi:predicted RNA-binding protein YlxR (DUF448 family)
VDLSGKLSGRGAYLHEDRSCWEAGLEGSLSRALKTQLSAEDLEHLKAFMETLPEKVFRDV